MRIYHGKEHTVLGDGSIAIEGAWAGVQPLAIGLAAALTFLALIHAFLLLVPALGFAIYLLILPTRRRVTFDARRRVLRIEHAGPFRERNARPIPFADLQAVRFSRAGRKGGRVLVRVVARTSWGDAYLLTLSQGTDGAALAEGITRALGQ
ncbi:MAG: hypothetical protein ABJE95_38305 [Byssovorax sp.]